MNKKETLKKLFDLRVEEDLFRKVKTEHEDGLLVDAKCESLVSWVKAKKIINDLIDAHEAELTTLRKDCQKIVSEVRVECDGLKKKLGEVE